MEKLHHFRKQPKQQFDVAKFMSHANNFLDLKQYAPSPPKIDKVIDKS